MKSNLEGSPSIVIPIHNERENIKNVLDEILAVQPGAEIIVVDDGSTDGSGLEIALYPGVIYKRLAKRTGQSAAISEGIKHVTHDICVIMDGDGQIDPKDIGRLVETLYTTSSTTIVAAVFGKREKRAEIFARRYASLVAYYARRLFLGERVTDSCGPKAIRSEFLPHLFYFDGMHRYMSVLLIHAKLKVIEIPVSHRPRKFGKSKYTITSRMFKGIIDIIALRRLLKTFKQKNHDRNNIKGF